MDAYADRWTLQHQDVGAVRSSQRRGCPCGYESNGAASLRMTRYNSRYISFWMACKLVSAAGFEPATHALKGPPIQLQTTTCTSSLLHARHNKINEMPTRHRSECPEGAQTVRTLNATAAGFIGRESSVRSVRYFETTTLLAHNHAVKDLRFLVKGQGGPAEAVEGDTTSESDTIQECSRRASLKLRHLQSQACLSDHR